MKWIRVAALAVLTIAPCLAFSAQSSPSRVRIDTGTLQGSVQDGITVFKGIPFAAPPVGQNRWRPPQPAAHWSSVRQATQSGPDCMQFRYSSRSAPAGPGLSENCLYVNVWTPAHKRRAKLPVMVWIYGGGFVNGGSSPPVYDGTHFAEHGVVFVSFNYRLGRFGFFGFPGLSREQAGQPLGNYGYMDQIAALRWVQHNIRAFGGNPSDVTIFGESAGGGSVLALLTSPVTKGLFEKAIVESGGGRDALLGVRYLDKPSPTGLPSAETVGEAFAKSNGIQGTGPAALAALRALPADKIVAGLSMATMGRQAGTFAGPIIDGIIVAQTPQQALLSGHYQKVPVLIGANSADIGFPRWHTLSELWAAFGPSAARAAAAYDPGKAPSAMLIGREVAADRMMVEPARFVASSIAAAGLPSYEYRFSYVAAFRQGRFTGAPHASEIPFVFDTASAVYGARLTPADEAVARQANAYWVNFAKFGNPNGRGLPHWPRYNAASDELMNFTERGPVAEPDPWRQRLDLIEAMQVKPSILVRSAARAAGPETK